MDIASVTRAVTQDSADMDDPAQHVAWALGSLPSANPEMGSVPFPPVARPLLSQLLWDLGFRHDPTKQTRWLIPGDHPEAGYLNVPKVVDRCEYDEWVAAHSDPDAEAEKWRATAEMLLGRLDPKLAQRIADMTPDQKEQAVDVQRKNLPPALARLAELAQTTDTEEPPNAPAPA